ncbi:MAG: hypothetical protein WKF40_05285 [Thermoleophilaceae bacterium]
METREGSFFDPVEGEEFDLIVSNPPYVISPDDASPTATRGLERDEVSRLAVTGAASHLAEGGHAMLPGQLGARSVGGVGGSDRPLARGQRLRRRAARTTSARTAWSTRPSGTPAHRPRPEVLGEVIDRWTERYRESGILTLATGALAPAAQLIALSTADRRRSRWPRAPAAALAST